MLVGEAGHLVTSNEKNMAALEDMVPCHGQSQGISEVTCKNQRRSLACDVRFFQGFALGGSFQLVRG